MAAICKLQPTPPHLVQDGCEPSQAKPTNNMVSGKWKLGRAIIILTMVTWIFILQRLASPTLHKREPIVGTTHGSTCQIPYLTPENLSEVANSEVPDCFNQTSYILFEISHNKLILTNPLNWASLSNNGSCYYTRITRDPNSPDYTEEEDTFKIQIKGKITLLDPTIEHIHVWCMHLKGGEAYNDYFSTVQIKPKLEGILNRARTSEDFYSLMILGMDSASHMNFIRRMPSVHNYLVEQLDAIEFHKFNSLGPTTFWSIYPLLSGLELLKFTKTCYGNGFFRQDCPFIWKEFEKRGYRTSYAEDDCSQGIFRPVGIQPFLRQPFHYDFRTTNFRVLDQRESEYCIGQRLLFDIPLSNIVGMAEAFPNKPHWSMIWTSTLSHSKNSLSQYAEPSMLKTLEYLHKNRLLNRTILILMSDHGMWWRDFIQSSEAAFLEQRLPMLYIVLPKSFRLTYPQATKNLQNNGGMLTTTFDIHEMMKDLLNLNELTDQRIFQRGQEPSLATQRNVSLFLPISPQRTCADAGISLINCACLARKSASVKEPSIIKAANFIVEELNKLIKGFSQCSRLELANITKVFVVGSALQEEETRKEFKVNKKAIESSHGEYFEVVISTKPGRGKYYVALISSGFDGEFRIDAIARTSIYGKDADCMPVINLKPYCYCR